MSSDISSKPPDWRCGCPCGGWRLAVGRLTLGRVAITVWCLAWRCLALLALTVIALGYWALLALRCITAVCQLDIVNAASQLDAICAIIFTIGFDVDVGQVEDVLRAFEQHGCQGLGTLTKESALNPLGRTVAVLAFFAVVEG